MVKRVHTFYFSATKTTERIVDRISRGISANLVSGALLKQINFTLPAGRKESPVFSPDDLVVVGVPVYAGRVPNILLKYMNGVSGNGAAAVAVVVYGNRHYDDALVELQDILEARGFSVIAAGAFVGEHSFSTTMGGGRPDAKDMELADRFALGISGKLAGGGGLSAFTVAGNRPYRDYYRPRNPEGQPVDFRRITPKTKDTCTDCKLCVSVCPMGSIDGDDVSKLTGICIKCCACVKFCPVGAKYFDDENYLRHKEELEAAFSARREPEMFL